MLQQKFPFKIFNN